MTLLADMLSTLFERVRAEDRDAGSDARSVRELAHALMSQQGETVGFTLAARLLDRFEAMNDEEKHGFFTFLTEEMDIDAAALGEAVAAYAADPTSASYRALMAAAEAPRQELVRRLNRAPGATSRLVAMRSCLRRLAKADPALGRADIDLRHLFMSWFNRGFLVLRPISWESPASILEKIIAYEAVHEIESWEDLRLRLAPEDRRCFAFFHPAMPGEPLIFVEVALTDGVPGSIAELLEEERAHTPAHKADTAVFYSISNCQDGLAGISFGNLLIKQVAEDLSHALPQLKTFVTLSPIPGLADWLKEQELEVEGETLRAAAADYLLNAKRADGLPLNPVARFHLENGAQVHEIHADADPSPRGMEQSQGAMVNYLYNLPRIADNYRAYAARGPIAATKSVRALAETGAKLKDKKRKSKNAQPAS
ncbi:malonyl-CoA decarboxylase [Pikeienuella sp. HZG-20]|uniref:malonyl-CoA decarboxylase n=1 Tax=Paludibacillus litoralis TaxID=3133267 RepID=UPI0030EF1CA8